MILKMSRASIHDGDTTICTLMGTIAPSVGCFFRIASIKLVRERVERK